MNPFKFFTNKQKSEILRAIWESENKTSGELRLHIENHCAINVITRAIEIFHMLQMQDTEHRNGVLIYIALEDKKVAIIGDEGIVRITPSDYWDQEVKLLLEYFKKDEYKEGIIKVIERIGEKLKLHFPFKSDDVNELSDEISFYNN